MLDDAGQYASGKAACRQLKAQTAFAYYYRTHLTTPSLALQSANAVLGAGFDIALL